MPKIEINTVEQCGLDRTDAVTSAIPPPAMGSNTIEQPPNACIKSPLTDPFLVLFFVYSEESPWKPTSIAVVRKAEAGKFDKAKLTNS